jgi:hypothetical protein
MNLMGGTDANSKMLNLHNLFCRSLSESFGY